MSNPESKKLCFCFNKVLGIRQLYRHLAKYRQRLELELAHETPDQNVDLDVGMDNDLRMEGIGNQGYEYNSEPAQPTIHANSDNAGVDAPLGSTYGLRRNPPVTVKDWTNPDLDLELSDSKDEDAGDPTEGPHHDPLYVEQVVPPGINPINEPLLTDEEMYELLRLHLGDMAEGKWVDMYTKRLSTKDHNTLSILATRLRTHFLRQTWDDLRRGVCKTLEMPTEFMAWRRLWILSGKYKDLDKCPFCNEARYDSRSKARHLYRYTPLIPQLHGLCQNRNMAAKLRYRARVEEEYDPDLIQDVFNGAHYSPLRETQLHPDNEYRIFDNPEDIALGISTDGFTLFKRRRRGLSTAWPIILINYNLHPRI